MRKKSKLPPTVPSQHNWRTTDADEINRRRERAQTESFKITNATPAHPIFSNFLVKSGSGLTYSVEVRDLRQRQFSCQCVDFRINGLGTCKHIEAVMLYLQARYSRLFQAAARNSSSRIEVLPDLLHNTLRVVNGHGPMPAALREWFNGDGLLIESAPRSRRGVPCANCPSRTCRNSRLARVGWLGSLSDPVTRNERICAVNMNSKCRAGSGLAA